MSGIIPHNKPVSQQNGFTLIEVLVAIAIVGIMAVAFLPLLTNNVSNLFHPGYRQQALYQAQSEMDNFTDSTTPHKITIVSTDGSKEVKGYLKTATKTVNGHTVSLYYYYVP